MDQAEQNLTAVVQGQAERVRARRPLLVHVGGSKDARAAELAHGLGQLVWKGPTGAQAIAELDADPLSGEHALLDYATYEYAYRDRSDLVMGAPVKESRVAVGFAPGLFAEPKHPAGLGHFLSEKVPLVHAQLEEVGHRCLFIPVVAMRDDWLTKRSLLEIAVAELRAFGGPVGVVLASANNPLGAAAQVRGWVDLLSAAGNVLSLRTDEAAVGALANGAVAASVGTSSSARHLFVGRPSKDRKRREGWDVLHPQTLSWLRTERFDGLALNVDDLLCFCRVCGVDGRSIRRLAGDGMKVEAIAHSIAVLQELAQQVVTADRPAERWLEVCDVAAAQADRLNRAVEGFALGRSVKAWKTALQLTG